MSICWDCYWGWPKATADIYQEALSRLDGDMLPLHFGPAHIVWEDENFHLAEWCLKNFDKYSGDYSNNELSIVKWSLEKLCEIPSDNRSAMPDDYDGWNPELYPPPDNVEIVKI